MKEELQYLDMLNRIEHLIKLMYQLSINTSGRTVEYRVAIGSEIFTRVITQLGTLLKTLPKSTHWRPTLGLQLWDFSSSCALTRSLVENYLSFWYYSIQPIEKDELEFRFLLFDSVPAFKRYHLVLMNNSNSEEQLQQSPNYPEIKKLKDYYDQQKNLIEAHPKFLKLEKGIRKEILNGLADCYKTKKEIINDIGMNELFYKSMYQYLSSFSHHSSYSLSQLKNTPAEHPEYYNLYGTLCQHIHCFILFFIHDFVSIQEDQKENLPLFFEMEYQFYYDMVRN